MKGFVLRIGETPGHMRRQFWVSPHCWDLEIAFTGQPELGFGSDCVNISLHLAIVTKSDLRET